MRTVTCEACGDVFESEATEEDALAEMRQNLGDLPEHDRATVCTPCYQKFMAMLHSGEPISKAGRERLS